MGDFSRNYASLLFITVRLFWDAFSADLFDFKWTYAIFTHVKSHFWSVFGVKPFFPSRPNLRHIAQKMQEAERNRIIHSLSLDILALFLQVQFFILNTILFKDILEYLKNRVDFEDLDEFYQSNWKMIFQRFLNLKKSSEFNLFMMHDDLTVIMKRHFDWVVKLTIMNLQVHDPGWTLTIYNESISTESTIYCIRSFAENMWSSIWEYKRPSEISIFQRKNWNYPNIRAKV